MKIFFRLIILYLTLVLLCSANRLVAANINNFYSEISLKTPGNSAKKYVLTFTPESGNAVNGIWKSKEQLPLIISQQTKTVGGNQQIELTIIALEDIYFNYQMQVATGFWHDDCQFYMPGFWYRRNLRSPKEAPSFHTYDSWTVREDRLSTPLTGIFNEKSGEYVTVTRLDQLSKDALTTHREGEVIVSGETSIGFTGFENKNGKSVLSFGFPYMETPKTYIRKLTLAPPVIAFQELRNGEKLTLTWEIKNGHEADYSEFVSRIWEYSYDTFRPTVVDNAYSSEEAKNVLSNFFVESFVEKHPLKYFSGAHLRVDDCMPTGVAEVGFIGRVLLNAANAWEYGEATKRPEMNESAKKIFDSYLTDGFSDEGFFKEFIDYDADKEEPIYSIRRQSEGVYAMFHYLFYEKRLGRKHQEWEKRLRTLLNKLLTIQNSDGSFPRKFKGDLEIIDESGGSTPSATLPLVLGYKYFNDKRYLEAAKQTAVYLENGIISKADYFSSTLDANCEDKEASLYASTANYYLALISKGEERKHYAALSRKAAYFALSWYYMWDVPFAKGQMLGDIGLKTRGWGNVSVENNHIDVFIFEFASVLDWLAYEYKEPRFSGFSNVIASSMLQLLPYEGHLCGIAKTGFYPEVVQHTNWDYGKNGKGFYNDIFAPGWTVASLWELLSPRRTENILMKK